MTRDNSWLFLSIYFQIVIVHLSGRSSIACLANDGGVSDPLVAAEHVPVQPYSLQTVPDEEVDHLSRSRAHYDVPLTVLVTLSRGAHEYMYINPLYSPYQKSFAISSSAGLYFLTVEGIKVDGLVLGSLAFGVDEGCVGGATDDGVAISKAPVDGKACVAVRMRSVVEESGIKPDEWT